MCTAMSIARTFFTHSPCGITIVNITFFFFTAPYVFTLRTFLIGPVAFFFARLATKYRLYFHSLNYPDTFVRA